MWCHPMIPIKILILVASSGLIGALLGAKLSQDRSEVVEKDVKHEAEKAKSAVVEVKEHHLREPKDSRLTKEKKPSVQVVPPISPVGQNDPLDNKQWLSLVEECVELFDELAQLKASFDPARQELIEHVTARLEEILVRSNVSLIDDDATFDRNRHQPERKGLHVSPRAAIGETLSPGFAVGRRVLRRAIVKIS